MRVTSGSPLAGLFLKYGAAPPWDCCITQMMTSVPAPTLYHRWLGWHAPAMRRTLTAFTVGVIVAAGLTVMLSWAVINSVYIRRTALAHALLSYLFGVVIVAGSVNLISGLFH